MLEILGFSLLLSLPLLGAGASSGDEQAPAKSLAETAASLLAAGDFEAVARMHHYPPSYTAQERRDDVHAVTKGLRFAFGRAGRISSMKPLREREEFYFIAMGGGDASYWESISPHRRAEYPYKVEFARFGTAMVKVVVLMREPAAGKELVGVELGLPVGDPHGKERLVQLSLDLLEEMKVPTPPNIEELVRAGMERAVVDPASSP